MNTSKNIIIIVVMGICFLLQKHFNIHKTFKIPNNKYAFIKISFKYSQILQYLKTNKHIIVMRNGKS